MLYYIFRFLDQFGISGSHMWSYISFRAILALILALIISAWFGEKFIKYMKRRNISETARDVSIDPFGIQKKGFQRWVVSSLSYPFSYRRCC